MNVKSQFSIKDLENLSGVKAHTIRIWEKRYNLLKPQRTETNIRTYDLESLKKLLNISFLYKDGLKISKIAELSEKEIQNLVAKQAVDSQAEFALKAFKTSMFDFDEPLFARTYSDLKAKRSFRDIFFNIFMPLLMEIGTLWQTNTIEPSHESFISELLKRKIILNIEEEVLKVDSNKKPLFVLFLPYKEIHEIGLLYTNYEILASGYRTIYLGANIPLDSLQNLLETSDDIVYVSYVTMLPEGKDIYTYINSFQDKISNGKKSKLWLLGSRAQTVDLNKIPSNVKILKGLPELIDKLENIKKA